MRSKQQTSLPAREAVTRTAGASRGRWRRCCRSPEHRGAETLAPPPTPTPLGAAPGTTVPGASRQLDGPLLGPEQAAELLSVKVSWVYDAVRTGRLPCLRVGRHIRFTRAMLRRPNTYARPSRRASLGQDQLDLRRPSEPDGSRAQGRPAHPVQPEYARKVAGGSYVKGRNRRGGGARWRPNPSHESVTAYVCTPKTLTAPPNSTGPLFKPMRLALRERHEPQHFVVQKFRFAWVKF